MIPLANNLLELRLGNTDPGSSMARMQYITFGASCRLLALISAGGNILWMLAQRGYYVGKAL